MNKNFWAKRFQGKRPVVDLIIEGIYLAIVFLTPLWFACFFPGYNLFELNKTVVFRILLWLTISLTGVRFLFSAVWRESDGRQAIWRSLSKYFFIPAALMAVLAVSLFFSIDFRQSYFGSYDRQQGLVSQFSYFIWALCIFVNIAFSGREAMGNKINRLTVVASLSGLAVAVYGILQIFNLDFLNWPEPPYLTGRALSTLGQPNFLASFLLLVIPVSVYLSYSKKNAWLKIFFALAALLQLICLFFTSSRGGVLALLLSIFIFVLVIFFVGKTSKKIKLLSAASLAAFLFLAIVFANSLTPGRLKESLDLSRGSFAARVNFYQAAADAITKKPVFGYGLENGGEIFIRYYERDWGIYGDVSSNTDRAHNLILDILLSVGFIGLAAMAVWYYHYFKLGFAAIRRNDDKKLSLSLAFAGAAYLLSLLFSFAIVAAEIYFWLFFVILALLDFYQQASADSLFRRSTSKRKIRWFLAVLIICFSLWRAYSNLEKLIADAYFNDIFIEFGRLEPVKVIVLHDYIREQHINSVQENFYDHFIGDNLSNIYDLAPDKTVQYLEQQRLEEILVSLPDYGYKNLLLKAKINSHLKRYDEADKYFSLILEQAPNWPMALLERGHDWLSRGDLAQAEKFYQAVDLNLPDITSADINDRHRRAAAAYKQSMYNSLGEAYFQRGDYERAKRFFQASYQALPDDYSLLKKIGDCYYLLGKKDIALKYIMHGAVLSPADYKWQVALAVLYFETGDKEKALSALDKALEISPDNAEALQLLKQYKQ